MGSTLWLLVIVLGSLALLPACSGESGPPAPEGRVVASGMPGVPDIQVEVLATGDGPEVNPGDIAITHYTGTFQSGEKFDSSRDRGEPFPVPVGMGQVIKGWDLVLAEMRVGDRWKVTIPWQLAYGERGHPAGIGPKTDLVFDMEVMRIGD